MAFSSSQSQTCATMSAEELRAISVAISRDYASRRFKAGAVHLTSPAFSPQELLGISQQISREFAPRAFDSWGLSKVTVLPVDPKHLHVYWQLEDALPGAAPPVEQLAAGQALTLRVYTQAEPHAAAAARAEPSQDWFDVPVTAARNQLQITLPDAGACLAGMCQVAIGRLTENREFDALAHSNTTAVAPQISPVTERLSPMMAQFIIPPSQASSALSVTASGQQH